MIVEAFKGAGKVIVRCKFSNSRHIQIMELVFCKHTLPICLTSAERRSVVLYHVCSWRENNSAPCNGFITKLNVLLQCLSPPQRYIQYSVQALGGLRRDNTNITEPLRGQDGGLLASFFFCVFMDRDEVELFKTFYFIVFGLHR